MPTLVGDRLPAPLRFDFGAPDVPGEPSHAVLLASMDADGSPRFAVLARSELSAPDDRSVRIALHADSATCANVHTRSEVSLWCVLDAAAYTVKGRARPAEAADGIQTFTVEVTSVWRDFQSDAPMVSGPMFRAPIDRGGRP